MFLFIGESLGWQELLLIGVVALIVLGPRKLPQLAKTIGKTMADFRKITNDFRSTWEKEVEEDTKLLKTFGTDPENEIPKINQFELPETNLLAPQVKELSSEEIEKIFKGKAVQSGEIEINESSSELPSLGKRDWL